ncbi:MAG TPA: PQQ-binding-like beta-propeller repeat protein [Acidimicrobiales bacterium]|nr:PQQ-binding-like beta-propeller repeat protein [Acidimicrobiales bacterium]
MAAGVVFTGSVDGSLNGFDAGGCEDPTCAALWSASAGSEITGAPAVSLGQLYVGTAEGRLVAYALPSAPSGSEQPTGHAAIGGEETGERADRRFGTGWNAWTTGSNAT